MNDTEIKELMHELTKRLGIKCEFVPTLHRFRGIAFNRFNNARRQKTLKFESRDKALTFFLGYFGEDYKLWDIYQLD